MTFPRWRPRTDILAKKMEQEAENLDAIQWYAQPAPPVTNTPPVSSMSVQKWLPQSGSEKFAGLTMPFEAIDRLLIKPASAMVTSPFTKTETGIPSWKLIPQASPFEGGEIAKAYERWQAPKYVKGGLEFVAASAIPGGGSKKLGDLVKQAAKIQAKQAAGKAITAAEKRILAQVAQREALAEAKGVTKAIPEIAPKTETLAPKIEQPLSNKGLITEGVKKQPTPEGLITKVAEVPPVKPPEIPPTAGGLAEPIQPKMPASQKVLSRISFEEPQPNLIEKIKAGLHRFNVAMIDDLYPIRKFRDLAVKGGQELSTEEDPYIWARMLRSNASKANMMLEQGTFGKTFWKMEKGKAVPNYKGKGLQQVLESVRKPTDWQNFTVYLTAKRAEELIGKNIKTGVDLSTAQQAIRELESKYPQFSKLARDVYKYQDDVLDYAQEMGLLSKDLLNRLKTHKAYVPFQRVFEELQARGFMGKKMANIVSPIKRIKGSERIIVNPLETIVKNTHLLVDAADRNQVGIMMANLVKKNPELAGLFQRIPAPTARVAKVTAKELGINIEGLSTSEMEQVFNVFRPSMFTKEGVISVLIDGKKTFFKVDPDLYKGLLNLDRESMGMLGRFLNMPAKWLRAGATLSPDFMIRNPVRDQLTAFVYSKYGFAPGIDFFRGLASIVGKDKYYQLYKMSGAEHSMLVSMDRQYLRSSFRQIVEGKKFTDYVKHPLELLQIASELGEKSTRLGEFIKGIKSGATPLAAGMSSREVTLDFAKMGTTARAVNTLIAFFNANIRGWDRMITAFRGDPIKTSAKVIAGITLPSILLYAANRNDPRWDEIPQWQKDLFWIVMTKDNIYRVPKPFELGILFGSIPERFLEYMDKKDPELFKEAITNAVKAGTPGFLPTALLPIVENLTNYSMFRGAPIIPAPKEAMPPSLQYGLYTSASAKKLGELINYSPAQIDNLINGYTAGLGRYAIDGLDAVLKKTGISPDIPEPTPELSDRPVLRSFVIRDPYGSSSASVDKFYKELGKYEQGEKYLKEMIKLNERAKFDKYKSQYPELLFFYDYSTNDYYSASARYMRRISKTMSEIRSKQTEAYNSKTISSEQKRIIINGTNKLITELAQKALAGLPGVNKQPFEQVPTQASSTQPLIPVQTPQPTATGQGSYPRPAWAKK